ncbi:carbon starvation protein A [Moorella thermoacetica]|uniref:Carbon starvation protein CstA n=1 Tax=Moorella thermoacetica (strain ATCC 39073 / JCM 9320) TaxID=264732 RepID=Q2RH28_MOOTA|nr:carbon starvation protein A [Moorella thermoacetica]AKX97417.1 carbon starvation protein A [Moorella thermoacetica]OIQ57164.1 carbon starvation protein A [Moorella thermoacetica]QDA01244.1 Carbon starvation protein A [Moorella thermoacetica]TYL10404.1 Peptide transporter CstA [Moorella thermoacetica]TYL10671.1 Peptide transporter CstA [Moorella thermoacetica]
MNALVLLIIAALVFVLAYRFYGAFMAAKVLALDPGHQTPALIHNDGRDYVPTNRWLVFGHHFAAIAGAGPLIGPVLAAQFGYLPGFLWILIGAVVAGAVHDMVILFASVRHDGQSLAEIARSEVSNFSYWMASIALLFLLIVVLAGASVSVVNALYQSPWGTFTVGVTIPIAIFIGAYLKWLRPGRIGEATVIGVALIVAGVVLGPVIQHSSLAPLLTFDKQQLSLLIAAYGFLAAVLPVWLLLVPRDYLSTYMKIGTMLLLAVGVIAVNPVLQMPSVTKFVAGGGPVIPGKVWPFMFITIACGALSGFHAMVSSGTTPKMITSEADIKVVGYGAMLVEGFVALMALIAATVLAPADYFAINSAPEVFAKLGMHVQDLPVLSQLVGENLAGRPGGAVSLAAGMAHIFSSIGGLRHLMGYWYHFAIMFEALFILTLIDAGTRVGRYLLQEIGGVIYKPLKDTNWWPGIILTSGIFTLAWGYLLYGGTISTIWPLFGVNNQLLGSMALAIGTTMLIRMGKVRYAWTTFIPMVFLTVTTITAGYQNIFINYLPAHNYLLAVISIIMLLMVIAIIIDSVRVWFQLLSGSKTELEKGRAASLNETGSAHTY